MQLDREELIQTRVGRVWVGERGTGPTLVLLHGVLSESTSWRRTAEALSEQGNYHLVLVDGPGHGKSDAPLLPISPDTYAEAVLEALDKRGVGPAVFVGLSLGGMVAQRVALSASERVRGLVLIGTQAERPSLPLTVNFFITASLVAVFGFNKPLRDGMRNLVFPEKFVAEHPEVFAELAERYKAWDQRKTYPIFLGLSLLTDIRPRLAGLRVPTLVVVGEHDRVAPPDRAERLAAAIPDARFVKLPGVGHVVSLEAPEVLAELLRDFLPEVLAS